MRMRMELYLSYAVTVYQTCQQVVPQSLTCSFGFVRWLFFLIMDFWHVASFLVNFNLLSKKRNKNNF